MSLYRAVTLSRTGTGSRVIYFEQRELHAKRISRQLVFFGIRTGVGGHIQAHRRTGTQA